jgi:hypothetical protein
MSKDLDQHKRKSYIEIGEIYFWTATINKWQLLLQSDEFKGFKRRVLRLKKWFVGTRTGAIGLVGKENVHGMAG